MSRPKSFSRVTRIIAVTLIVGVLLVSASAIVKGPEKPGDVVWRLVSGLGEAAIIAGIVAFAFERLLSEERIREIEEIFKLHRRLEKFGFKATYANRQEVFDEILGRVLVGVQHDLRIMGICVSLFRETTRGKASLKRDTKDKVIDTLASLVHRGVSIHVLFLKRTPPAGDDVNPDHDDRIDLIYMRERDEDSEEDFQHGKRLKGIANRSIADWIDVLIAVAERTKTLNVDDRREILHRLQIREYVALPSLSLYILDDDIYVTPYLFKRHCSDVPAFRVGGKDSPLFMEYFAHFNQTWHDRYTVSTLPPQFIEKLASDTESTLRNFAAKRSKILTDLDDERKRTPEVTERPEYYSVSERAIREIIVEDAARTRSD